MKRFKLMNMPSRLFRVLGIALCLVGFALSADAQRISGLVTVKPASHYLEPLLQCRVLPVVPYLILTALFLLRPSLVR